MKRKKKDLNQHSWKVHILQFLTVGFALCFLSCTSDICGGFDVFPGSERMLASDDCSRIVCDSAYIDVL